MPTVTSDLHLNRNELIRTPLRANYMGMKHLGLPWTVLEADFLVSMPKIKTHRWWGVTLSLKNMFGVALGTRYGRPNTKVEKPPMVRRPPSKVVPEIRYLHATGCGCNCGCTLLHISNVSSICG
jgi:hypothetical protein